MAASAASAIVLGSTLAVLTLPACAGVVDHEGASPGVMEFPLRGKYSLTLHTRDVGSVTCRVCAEPTPEGFRANTRPGALSDRAGRWRGLLAALFARERFPGGVLLHWRSGNPQPGRTAQGVLDTPVRRFRSVVATPQDPIELRDGSDRLVGLASLAPWEDAGADGGAGLADRVDESLRARLFDPEAADLPGVRSFVERIREVEAQSGDELEIMFAAFVAREDIEFSHLMLLRELDPAAKARFSRDDAPASNEEAVALTADGVLATLRVRHFDGVADAIDRAFEELARSGARALLVDLRGNAGGDYSSLRLAAHLLEGPVPAGVLFDRHARAAVLRGETSSFPRMTSVASVEALHDLLDQHHAIVASVEPVGPRFAGPVAVLVDGRCASATEPVAHLLRSTGRARLFGARTAGAMLSSRAYPLGGGWRLVLPAYDFVTAEGRRIEGVGVSPDHEIGGDGSEAAARAWLQQELGR